MVGKMWNITFSSPNLILMDYLEQNRNYLIFQLLLKNYGLVEQNRNYLISQLPLKNYGLVGANRNYLIFGSNWLG